MTLAAYQIHSPNGCFARPRGYVQLPENRNERQLHQTSRCLPMKSKGQSNDRSEVFDRLRQQVTESVSVLDLTSPALAGRGHSSWVWDASAMPAGGHYFPVFIELIARFEKESGIRPDTHVLVETTTGTAGIALGFVAKQLGYDIILFMPEDMPRRRIDAVRSFLPSPASELRLTPSGQYAKGMLRTFQRFLVENRTTFGKRTHKGKSLFALNHSRRPEAISSLVPVVLRALKMLPASKPIDHAVAALGNGTSSTAVFNAVRQLYANAKLVGVEPNEAPAAYVAKYGEAEFIRCFGHAPQFRPHEMLGTGGWGVSCPHLDVSVIDEVLPVDAEKWRRVGAILAKTGFGVGNSSAGCQSAVETLSEQCTERRANFFSMIYDKLDLY